MEFEYQLSNGLTVEKLEEMVNSSNKKEDLENELAKSDFDERNMEAKERWLAEVRNQAETRNELREEFLQKLADENEEREMLASASPELINAVANIKTLEAQLAEKEWENKRLTALISELEHKLRDATKIKK
jgi:GTP1/Obg family GTP-binding protein